MGTSFKSIQATKALCAVYKNRRRPIITSDEKASTDSWWGRLTAAYFYIFGDPAFSKNAADRVQ